VVVVVVVVVVVEWISAENEQIKLPHIRIGEKSDQQTRTTEQVVTAAQCKHKTAAGALYDRHLYTMIAN
jgi:hypothetical protein